MKFTFSTAWKVLTKGEFDFIYVHYLNHSLLPLIFCSCFIRKPIFLNAHGGDILPETFFNRILARLTRSFIKKATKVIVPSTYFSELVQKKFQLPEQKIFVSPSGGVDTNLFRPSEKPNHDHLNLIFVSRIERNKGWKEYIKLCDNLKKENIIFNAIIIGSGSESDLLSNYVEELQLQNEISLMTGLPQHEIAIKLAESNLFIFPSYRESESLGLVGLEAMACGLPVIGSHIGGIKEYVIDGYNGFVFEPQNINQMRECVIKYAQMNIDAKNMLAENARKTAMNFDSQKIGKELSAELKRVIGK